MLKRLKCPQCEHVFDEQPAPHESHVGDSRPVEIAGAGDAHSHRTRRGRKTRRGVALRVAAVCLLVAATAVVAIVVSNRLEAAKEDALGAGPSADVGTSKTQQTGETQKPEAFSKSDGRSSPPQALSGVLRAVEQSIVRIEAGHAGHTDGLNSFGTGFVLDDNGLIATSYHVVADATAGRVQFKDNVFYEIEGYAAVDPQSDLAILRLKETPSEVVPVRIRTEELAPQAEVIAIGHPHGVAFSNFDGTVSQILKTSQLSGRSQRFLRIQLDARREHLWIQHTARLSEGNSGGPLIDAQGRVAGINMWVDQLETYGYAMHIGHLTNLRRNMLPEVAPLEKYATREARVVAKLQRMTKERLKEAYRKANMMGWGPGRPEQYQTLQDLAWALTLARFPDSVTAGVAIDDTIVTNLIRAADEVEADLAKDVVNIFQQLNVLNDFAAKAIYEPSAGVVLVGTVTRTFASDNGSTGMLMTLAGFDDQIFMPLDDVLVKPAVGAHCLVFGVNHNGRRVQFGDNPLQPVSIPVIVSRTILSLD